MTQVKRKKFMNIAHVSKLGFGIHDNVVITKIDTTQHKHKGIPDKKMIHVTFATVDPTTRKRKAEVILNWFKFDHTSEYLFSNIRELAVQLHGILACYSDEEKAFLKMKDVFKPFSIKTVDELETYKWKKKELESLVTQFKTLFEKAMSVDVELEETLIRLKVTTDSKGEYTNIPKFGKFTEPMAIEQTTLQFSNFELKNHSKAGNISTVATGNTDAPEL